MDFKEVVILCDKSLDNWELTLVRGSLLYFDIPSRVIDYASFSPDFKKALVLIIPTYQSKEDVHARIGAREHIQGIIILAGRYVTLNYLQKELHPNNNEILILGEPYTLIPQLVKKKELVSQLKGKTVLGPLLDPREYRTPSITSSQSNWAYLMTSLGCQKRCGYCTYGTTYSNIYQGEFTRRSRPWQNLVEDIRYSMGKGIDHFWILADQFLAREPKENRELYYLASYWKPKEMGQPTLHVNLSPIEVLNNKELLEAMTYSFRLHPRLSIDSLDNNTLTLFDLDFDVSTALEALEYLAELRLPLRLNYIFVRPGVTNKSIKEEFSNLEILANAISYLSPKEKLFLSCDLFFSNLKIHPSAPIILKKGIREGYEEDLPSKFMRVFSTVQNALRENIIRFQPNAKTDPLRNIIRAGLKEAISP